MEIDKSVLLGHLELLQGIGGSSRSDYDLTNKVIITKEGLINSFQGAFVTLSSRSLILKVSLTCRHSYLS